MATSVFAKQPTHAEKLDLLTRLADREWIDVSVVAEPVLDQERSIGTGYAVYDPPTEMTYTIVVKA